MDKKRILDAVVSVVSDYLDSQGIECDVNPDTTLFGDESVLDSMGLVNIVIDLESAFLDAGYEISLTSDVAMSRRQSPFRSVSSLVQFIDDQINANG